jgi:hypothetical protein
MITSVVDQFLVLTQDKAQIGEGLQWLPGLLSKFTCFLQGTY